MFGQETGSGFTIWLTGMQLAGKKTLAREIAGWLKRLEKPVESLEGAEWEQFIGRDPGDSTEERNAIVRRTGFVARAITRAGGFAVTSLVSPYRDVREQLRREIGRFLEVFVDCPIEALLDRDTKGEYQKAMRGEIKNFIGITDPYEPPTAPEVRYDSSAQTAEEGAALVIEALVREGVLTEAEAGLAHAPAKLEKHRPRRPPPSVLFTPEMLRLAKESKAHARKPLAKEVKTEPAPKAEPVPAVAKVDLGGKKKPAAGDSKKGEAASPSPAKTQASAKASALAGPKEAAKGKGESRGAAASKKTAAKPPKKAAIAARAVPQAKVEARAAKPLPKTKAKPAGKPAAKNRPAKAAKKPVPGSGKAPAKKPGSKFVSKRLPSKPAKAPVKSTPAQVAARTARFAPQKKGKK